MGQGLARRHGRDHLSSMADTIYDFQVTTLEGTTHSLDGLRGQVALVVNVASECGFTPQYTGLQKLHDELQGEGFSVLGFPCNQFGGQEPGSAAEIGAFCTSKYSVTFPMHAKVEVNGDGAHPLFKHLKSEAPGLLGSKGIKWNFTKFLVGKDGSVVKRYAPTTKPEEIAGDVRAELAK